MCPKASNIQGLKLNGSKNEGNITWDILQLKNKKEKYIKTHQSSKPLKDSFGLLGSPPAKLCKFHVNQFGLSMCI